MSRVTAERAEELFEQTKCWGRWGADDERGALNLLTPDRVTRAISLVRRGAVVSCGRELPVRPAIDNPTPAQHHMLMAGDVLGAAGALQSSADFVGVAFHGMAVSHIDALCHVFVEGQMYNGYPASDVTSLGARRNSIAAAFDGIVGRGVLLDIPRHRGAEWLEPGDILLISTGRDARRAAHGPWEPNQVGLAGLDPECIMWLNAHDPAVLGSDGVSDPLPGNAHAWPIPVHQCLLVGMGVHLLDNLQLGRLAATCAAEQRWEFLFLVAPLQIGGGTGSPVNPVAVL